MKFTPMEDDFFDDMPDYSNTDWCNELEKLMSSDSYFKGSCKENITIGNSDVDNLVSLLCSNDIDNIKIGLSIFFNNFNNIELKSINSDQCIFYNNELNLLLKCIVDVGKFRRCLECYHEIQFHIEYNGNSIEIFRIKDINFTVLFEQLVNTGLIGHAELFIDTIINYKQQ